MLPFRSVCRPDSRRCDCATEHKYNKFNTRCAKSICIKIEGLKRSKPSTSTFFFVVAFENFSRARDNGSIQSIVCVIHIVILQSAQITAAQRSAVNDEQNENGQTFDFVQGVVPFTG